MTHPSLTHRARLETCLAGSVPDRVPVSLWRHFPIDDQTPEGLAAAAAAFQRTYDFDLIKITPASSFCLKDWGAIDEWRGNTEGTRDYTSHPIRNPEDWDLLAVLDPLHGSLGQQITCIRLLAREFSPHTPILQTIFSPLAQAKNLVGPENLLVHLRNSPEALHQGLQAITTSTILFIEEVVKTGIDGIFYAIQHAQSNLLSETEFAAFGKFYDLQVLQSAQEMWLNMAHLHGENIMFDMVRDYPVQAINWHDRHTSPGLAQAQSLFPGIVCGGLRRWETMVIGNPVSVITEAEDAIQATAGKRFILGTGCVLPIISPYGNILAARKGASISE